MEADVSPPYNNSSDLILIRGNHEDLFVELVTTDAGMPYSYHKSNGTNDACNDYEP